MLTRKQLLAEMATSEACEERTYKELTQSLFLGIQEPLRQLYDVAVAATGLFASITSDELRGKPRIIKTLRYCLAPVISQMRLGQLIGIGTTEAFEEQGATPTPDQAERLAEWFRAHLDRERFRWLGGAAMSEPERRLAEIYARLWTVSLQSNQNTSTQYRNQRKERQEQAIADALLGIPLTFQPAIAPSATGVRHGGVNDVEDIRPRHFAREKKVLGGSQKKQKADVIVRPTDAPLLFCIEAKAVGIRLDSTKRLKELSDKQTDWKGSSLPVITIGVIAGMFSVAELVATIKLRGIPIFFEHDLGKLTEFLTQGTYFGSGWNHLALFPNTSADELQKGLKKLQSSTAVARAGDWEASPGE